jgi:hypothetical protein
MVRSYTHSFLARTNKHHANGLLGFGFACRFGLRDFLILAPLSDKGCGESEASLLLSTLSIVINDTKWYVPFRLPQGLSRATDSAPRVHVRFLIVLRLSSC